MLRVSYNVTPGHLALRLLVSSQYRESHSSERVIAEESHLVRMLHSSVEWGPFHDSYQGAW